ncbi:MAG: tetratricopeptide repeat protein [Pseudomonadota bacterium]
MKVRLLGVFEIRDPAGRDCTPRGAKARALVAMLCRTPDRRRTRRWLEARLWSDRGPEQASGSLRQALMELRRAFGDHADLIEADRDLVILHGVETDLEGGSDEVLGMLRNGREFLEGIDISDQAFEDWLRDERSRVSALADRLPSGGSSSAAGTALPPLPLAIRLGSLPQGSGSFAGMALADSIARLVAEFAPIDVYGAGGAALPPDMPETGLQLGVEGAQIADRLHLVVRLSGPGPGPVLWHQQASLPLSQSDFIAEGEFPQIVFQTAEAAMAAVPGLAATQRGPARASALIARAVVEMFSYDSERLRKADALLAEAHDIDPQARCLAWRSLVRQIQFVERTEPDRARLTSEADEFARKALEMTDTNALVLALVSQVRVMLDSNPEAGAVLARDAIALSPFNPFGYAAQSGAMLRYARHAEALSAARTGAEITSRTKLLHWWESLSGLAALAAGQHSAAIAHCEAAHYRAPSFRSPMRHLVFLYLAAGEETKARRVMTDLLRAEPDFTIDRVRNDPDYPAATLRRSGLLDRVIHDFTIS